MLSFTSTNSPGDAVVRGVGGVGGQSPLEYTGLAGVGGLPPSTLGVGNVGGVGGQSPLKYAGLAGVGYLGMEGVSGVETTVCVAFFWNDRPTSLFSLLTCFFRDKHWYLADMVVRQMVECADEAGAECSFLYEGFLY
jgi:hypothetical protein